MSGADDDPCACGHPRARHLNGYGVCFHPEGMMGSCSLSCRKFVLDEAALSVREKREQESAKQHARISKARKLVDAKWKGDGWKPSELMTIGYCILATSLNPEKAAPWLDDLLNDARDRFRRGEDANPFASRVPS